MYRYHLPCLDLSRGLGDVYKRQVIYTVENCSDRGRTGKVPSGISGQAGNTGKLSMVTVLVVCPMTGACHAPVDSRQGESW